MLAKVVWANSERFPLAASVLCRPHGKAEGITEKVGACHHYTTLATENSNWYSDKINENDMEHDAYTHTARKSNGGQNRVERECFGPQRFAGKMSNEFVIMKNGEFCRRL